LCTAIEHLAKNKSPGPDKIPNEIWKALSEEQNILLLETINDIWYNNVIPTEWSKITIVPIYKKGDKLDPSNYRPISLVNTSLKLLTMLMTNRLSKWCVRNNVISEFQGAYKKGVGCQDHVFVLRSALEYQLSTKNSKVFALFVDLSKAFENISHDKL
jgi:hypothetical protein